MVGSCAPTDPTYNRPGELAIVRLSSDLALSCSVLDGHSHSSPLHSGMADNASGRHGGSSDRASLGSLLRSTVTSTLYDVHYGAFISAAHDGRVSFWHPTAGTLYFSTWSVEESPVNCVAQSASEPILAFGSQQGDLHLARYNCDEPAIFRRSVRRLAGKGHVRWANSVDHALIPACGPDRNNVIASVGYDGGKASGMVGSFAWVPAKFQMRRVGCRISPRRSIHFAHAATALDLCIAKGHGDGRADLVNCWRDHGNGP